MKIYSSHDSTVYGENSICIYADAEAARALVTAVNTAAREMLNNSGDDTERLAEIAEMLLTCSDLMKSIMRAENGEAEA